MTGSALCVPQSAFDTFRVHFTPQDAKGIPLGPHAQVSLVVNEDSSTPQLSVVGGQLDNGEAYFIMRAPPGFDMGGASGDYEIWVEGQLVISRNYDF